MGKDIITKVIDTINIDVMKERLLEITDKQTDINKPTLIENGVQTDDKIDSVKTYQQQEMERIMGNKITIYLIGDESKQ